MSRRPTYSLSALFLLMTIVGVLAAIASSPAGGTQLFTVRDSSGEAHSWPTIAAFCVSGAFGAIVMAYNTWKLEMLASGALVGGGIGLVALRVLLWPNNFPIILGGAAMILAYAIVVRLANPRSADDPPKIDGA
jgi:hypothetical protein